MRSAATAVRRRIHGLYSSQKEFLAKWHTLATPLGLEQAIATLESELSNLLAGKERGFRFFFMHERTPITAQALEWSVDELLQQVGMLPERGAA